MSTRVTTPDVRAKILEMRENGFSYTRIAARYKVSVSCVEYHCLMAGADPPGPPRSISPRRQGPIKRGRSVVHPFTKVDDVLILSLTHRGVSNSQIAQQLTTADPSRPRRPHTIKGRLATLARQEARAEQMQAERGL
jgi:hypothetical protein